MSSLSDKARNMGFVLQSSANGLLIAPLKDGRPMTDDEVASLKNTDGKEIKRDLLKFARDNSRLFIELANDENVQLRNFGIKATEMGIIKLSSDQRTFSWGSNDRKVMTVPFDENPYSALAAYFKTDDGIEIYQNIEKQL